MTELHTILHVDDDPDILEIARVALGVLDTFQLHQSNSGKKALEDIETAKPDLLLLDVMMPEMTGPDLWKKLKEDPAHSDIPAIFMTAMAEDAMAEELLQDGALAVITKPFDPMQLGEKIRDAWTKQ